MCTSDLSAIDPDTSQVVNIKELQDVAVSQLVTVTAKIVTVRSPESVNSKVTWRELTKQECVGCGVESEIAEAGMFGESAIFIHHEVLEVVANSDGMLSWSYKVSGTSWE